MKQTTIDRDDIVNYYTTIQVNFLSKLSFLASYTLKNDSGENEVKADSILLEHLGYIEPVLPHPQFYRSIKEGSSALHLNLQDDLATSAIVTSWNVFERIIKLLKYGNYSQESDKNAVDFLYGFFGFNSAEKNDLHFLYYVRNSIAHHNGVYYAYKEINHTYEGAVFKSKGNEGIQIEITNEIAYSMIRHLNTLSLKAWDNLVLRCN